MNEKERLEYALKLIATGWTYSSPAAELLVALRILNYGDISVQDMLKHLEE